MNKKISPSYELQLHLVVLFSGLAPFGAIFLPSQVL